MRLVTLALLALGWLTSGYLLLRHFELRLDPESAASSGVCEAVTGAGCDAALRSDLGTWWGLPLAGWGLAYFGTLAVLVAAATVLGGRIAETLDRWNLAVLAIGTLVSIGLLGAMMVGFVPFCPLCCVVHLVNLTLAVVGFRSVRTARSLDRTAGAVGTSNVAHATRQENAELVVGATLLSGVAALLAGLATGLWVLLLTFWFPSRSDDPQADLAAFALLPRWDIPVDRDDPRLGAETAPVQIVVFSDFECVSCRRVARDLARIRAEMGDQFSIVFKNFPLGSDCNPQVRANVHPQACNAARMSEAARLQGLFWDFHDMVFEGIGLVGISADRVSQQIGVDKTRLEREMQSREVEERIRASVELGGRLGVEETPAVFIGGRRAPGTSLETLRILIDAERANGTRKAVPRGTLQQNPGEADESE